MSRRARVVAPGRPHHVTQRGNRRQAVFFSDGDYRSYLLLMRQWCSRMGVSVWAYCLMPNHVHLILVPPSEQALCRAVGEAHRRYTVGINQREGWQGHLWQGRFASFVMDQSHLLAAARYIERNPVHAGLVGNAEEWPWSSAAAHVSGRSDGWVQNGWLTDLTAGWCCTWGQHLREPDEPTLGPQLRRHESTGKPLGDESFLRQLTSLLGCDLVPKPAGRPRIP